MFDNVTITPVTNAPPTVVLVAPTNGATFLYGTDITVSANATAVNGGIANVSFFRELTKLGEDVSPAYDLVWSNAPAGSFSLRAVATDFFGTSATSAPVNVSINTPLGTNGLVVKVNFQTNSSTLFAGYLPDYGLVFGDRGNGFSYGWDINNVPNSRYRNSPNSFDLRYDTFNHLQKPGGGTTWEIAVPNGLYQVRAVSGDATAFDGTFRLNVEGSLIVDGAPSITSRWVEGIGTIAVNDGRLTVGNAAGSVNNKICFIEITALPVLHPPIHLLSPELLTDGRFRFTLEGTNGVTYVIEATTNFTAWTPLFTNAPISNLLEFTDSLATNHPARFYRGREQ
jgi:hypothetical protein